MDITGSPQSRRPLCRRLMGIRVLTTGSYVPDGVVTNAHLGQHYHCDPDWIVRRTGILERRHSLPHQATSDLCYEAAKQCLDRAGVQPDDVDLLLVGTYTPDMSFPSTASILQERLGLVCPATDVQAACAGFMYAFITGAAYIVSGPPAAAACHRAPIFSNRACSICAWTAARFSAGRSASFAIPSRTCSNPRG
jgi:3-oxoacyl-[acyl-carrier-protein] synthase III